MKESLKTKTLKGVVWTGLDRILNQVVQFFISIVLARLLSPSDYGVLGIMNVFLGIAGLFVDCGLSAGLLRKKDKTDEDYSTVFWCNLVMSSLCYLFIFFSSPFIASYYNIDSLKLMLRVLGLILIINALFTVQITRLTSLIDFKSQTKVSFSSCIISGSIGLYLAYSGWGPWSLVVQQIFAAIYKTFAYWFVSGWHPKFVFSKKSFASFFSFGSRLLLASILGTIYNYISPLIIGKKYTMSDLGNYTRADSFVHLPGGIFQSTFGRVIYPVLISIQDEEIRLREAYKKYLRIITSLVVPTMLLLAAVSEPLILVLIGEKWKACVPYIMILAVGWMVDPIVTVNLNIIYVKGRSDIVLKLEVIKKIIALSIVIFSLQFGVIWLCVGRCVYSYIALVINIWGCRPFIGMSFFKQVQEVWKMYVGGIVAAVLSFGLNFYIMHYLSLKHSFVLNVSSLVLASCLGVLIYIGWAYFWDFEIIKEAKFLLLKFFKR